MKHAVRPTVVVASIAAALEAFVPLLPAQYQAAAHPVIAAVVAVTAYLMRSPLTPKLPTLDPLEDEPRNRSASTFPPAVGLCLLMLPSLSGCGAAQTPVDAARSIAHAAVDCGADVATAETPEQAVQECAPEAFSLLQTVCTLDPPALRPICGVPQ